MGLSKEAHDKWRNRTQAIGLLITAGFNLVVFLGLFGVDLGGVSTASINLIAGAATGFSRQLFTLITGYKLDEMTGDSDTSTSGSDAAGTGGTGSG